MNNHDLDYCPHCGQRDLKSAAYRNGQRAGEKILSKCAGDEKKRAAWMSFIVAFREVSLMSFQDVRDHLQGAYETVEAAGKAKPE